MARRRRVLPPYVSEDVSKTGQVRVYYRAPTKDLPAGERPPKIRIWVSIEREGFWPAYEAAKRGEQLPKPQVEKRRAPGTRTFESLCLDYYRSAEFQQLTPISQRTRRGILKHCCGEETRAGSGLRIGDTPIDVFGGDHVKVLRDRKAGMPEAANNRVKALRGLFKWHLKGKRGVPNPCDGFEKLDPINADGFHTWTMEEVGLYEAKHRLGTMARLALDLARFTTQRKADVARLGPQHVVMHEGMAWLSLQQQKTKRVKTTKGIVEIPIIEPLAVSIAARPLIRPTGASEAFLMTSFGRPYTANGLGNAFRGWCDEAGLPQCSMHGLRKATASQFAELGVNEDGIGAVTGHAPGSRELSRYTRGARKRILASKAFRALQDELSKTAGERLGPLEIKALDGKRPAESVSLLNGRRV